jgi:hypothetical protein
MTFPLLQGTVQLNIGQTAENVQLSGSENTFADFVGSTLQATMVIAALLLLFYLIWAGIEWISAGGDSGKIEKARTKITQSIVGIIVLASTIALFSLVQRFLGIEVLNFGSSSSSSSTGSSSNGVSREQIRAIQRQLGITGDDNDAPSELNRTINRFDGATDTN